MSEVIELTITMIEMEAKEELYSSISESLFGVIKTQDISKVIDVVSLCLSSYEIERKCTDIVVYDFGDSDLLKKFFIAKATEGLSKNSLEAYRRTLSYCIGRIGKHIRDITTDDIRVLITSMRIDNKSTSYQNFVRRTFSSFFSFLSKEKLLDENPMLRIPSIKEQRKIKKAFSEEELERIRCNAGSIRNEAIVEFLFSTGCRISEMTSLNRDDLDLDNNQVQVLGKGNKYRMLYFSFRCRMLLIRYLESRKDDHEALFVSDFSKCPQISSGVERIGKSGVERMVSKIGKKAGVSNVHPHRFRRTAATLALKRGMKITDVQKMLGHSDIKTTTIYALSSDDEVKREHEKFLN